MRYRTRAFTDATRTYISMRLRRQAPHALDGILAYAWLSRRLTRRQDKRRFATNAAAHRYATFADATVDTARSMPTPR
jgi:hypothetical protein